VTTTLIPLKSPQGDASPRLGTPDIEDIDKLFREITFGLSARFLLFALFTFLRDVIERAKVAEAVDFGVEFRLRVQMRSRLARRVGYQLGKLEKGKSSVPL
jgi:hypothetical protein